MRRIAIFFVLAILVLMPISTMAASAPQVSCKGGTCTNLKISKVTIHPVSKTAPSKVGFTSYISGKGTVRMVVYTVINSKTGKVAGSCRSFCPKCVNKKICACTCVIKAPGTYDLKVTLYGSGNCCVTKVIKSAFKLN